MSYKIRVPSDKYCLNKNGINVYCENENQQDIINISTKGKLTKHPDRNQEHLATVGNLSMWFDLDNRCYLCCDGVSAKVVLSTEEVNDFFTPTNEVFRLFEIAKPRACNIAMYLQGVKSGRHERFRNLLDTNPLIHALRARGKAERDMQRRLKARSFNRPGVGSS